MVELFLSLKYFIRNLNTETTLSSKMQWELLVFTKSATFKIHKDTQRIERESISVSLNTPWYVNKYQNVNGKFIVLILSEWETR